MKRLALGIAVWLAMAGAAFAIDPGIASGSVRHEGQTLTFTHAVALSQDNTEGAREHSVMRVLLTDEEVPPAALEGLIFTPVWTQAREGKVRGLLLEFDPADRTSLHAVVLTKPPVGQSLTNISRSSTEGLWKRLEVSPTRIVGEFKPGEDDDMAFTFSAPVFTNAVQQDLKGTAAQASEPVRVLIARYEALARGDLAAALAMSTEDSGLRSLPPGQLKAFQGEIAGSIRQLRQAKRVVIRLSTAAVLTPDDSWYSLARTDGGWKVVD
jgi:hypothetical protein